VEIRAMINYADNIIFWQVYNVILDFYADFEDPYLWQVDFYDLLSALLVVSLLVELIDTHELTNTAKHRLTQTDTAWCVTKLDKG
jgi:hypothetical protein